MLASWIYLVVSVWAAIGALAAIAPPTRIGMLFLPQFLFAMLPSSLPLHHLAAIALVSVLAVAAGALDHAPGLLAAALSMLSASAYVVCHTRNSKAGEALARALRDALGPEYEAGIDSDRAILLRCRVPLSLLLRPFALKSPNVEVLRDLSYGPHGERNLLDIYRSREPRGPSPVLVWVHGGAWIYGHKAQQAQPMLRQLASRGWVCVAINYRLGPSCRLPDHIVDVKASLAWIRENIDGYGGDATFVAICGGSAGGHLAALAALSPNRPEWQPGFEGADTSVEAALPLYGRYDFLDATRQGKGWSDFLEAQVMPCAMTQDLGLWEAVSPRHQLRRDAPPFFIIHGTRDALIPVDEAREFAVALGETSRSPVAYAELVGSTHAFDLFHAPVTEQAIDAMHRFLEYQFSRRRRSVPAVTAPGHDQAPVRAA